MDDPRSLGPSVIMDHFPNHWIFWVGPFIGAIIAAIFHVFVFKQEADNNYNVRKSEHPNGVTMDNLGYSN